MLNFKNIHSMHIMKELPTNKPIISSTTHRISTRLYMQNQKKLLSLLIISVYILTALYMYRMFLNGQVMVTWSHQGRYQILDFCWNAGLFSCLLFHNHFSKMVENRRFNDSELRVSSFYFNFLHNFKMSCMPKCSTLCKGKPVSRSLRNIL